MEYEKALKHAITADDSLQNLVQTFGSASLENWLENGFGEALGKCLADEAKTKNLFAIKYLDIVNALIPPIPNFMDDEFGTTSLEDCLIQSDLNQVAMLITQIIRSVIVDCKYLYEEPLYSKVLLKTVYYASENDIKDKVISDELIEDIYDDLEQCCNKSSHTVMALITILGKKMPEAWFQEFLEHDILIQIRMVVMLSEEKMCPYVDSLHKLYYDLNLEDKFETMFPVCKALLETSHMFQEECLVKALRCISQIMSENDICMNQFIMSGLLHKFHTLLCKPSEIGDQTFVIKSFLTVFLSFKTKAESHYEWKIDLFEKLIDLVHDTIEYRWFSSDKMFSYRKVHTESPLTTIERFENDAILALQLLESLYVLNSSWYQWFDIMEEKKIIDVSLFQSNDISYHLLEEQKQSLKIKNLPRLVNFIRICPAIVSVECRLKIFKKVNSKKVKSSNDAKCFEVRRSDVLSDVFDKFSQNGDCLGDRWNFVIKDEIAEGPGVTKEVYSIFSQELQSRETGLWQGQPIKVSDNEMKCTYFRDGLVPNVNEEIQNFKLLGKIMAKVFLDKKLLDIPLSNEFFQRLKTTHHEKYSHLKREYFYLLQTFPMLESLYKQLLPIKRKVEFIRSEIGLTQNEKQEIIDNLTFDDGSSFDDLCLNFTVPGTDVELVDGGHDIILSPYNIDSYLEKLCAFRAQLDPVSQFKAIREGFDEVLSPGSVDLLLPDELQNLFCCGEFRRWTVTDLQSNCKYKSSQSVEFLFETLSSFDTKMQKLFLKFVTGTTCLPIGGLSKLKPPLTITKIKRDHADSSLPTAATCFNLLDLPEYSSLSVTHDKLVYAIHEGSNSFGFV